MSPSRTSRTRRLQTARFHDLRHFTASALIRYGESVKTGAHVLRHADETRTLRTYSHLWLDADARTRVAVDEALLRRGLSGPGGSQSAVLAELSGQFEQSPENETRVPVSCLSNSLSIVRTAPTIPCASTNLLQYRALTSSGTYT